MLKKIYEQAKQYQDEIQSYRRYLHKHPEIGLELPITKKFVMEELTRIGYEPKEICNSGIVATVGKKKDGKVFLLRADMDALPIVEKAEVEYRSENNNMHGCGHDMHTAMLLGAARVLKDFENEIPGTVKLMFQPGEETGDGAISMLNSGVLENPRVDAAMMLHVLTGLNIPMGMATFTASGAVTSSCDTFKITIEGKGGHGAMPELSIDPINAASYLQSSMQTIISRELSPFETVVLTVGSIKAGDAPNIIAEKAELMGTIRTFDDKIRTFVKCRLKEISAGIASAFRCKATVDYVTEVPVLITDKDLKQQVVPQLEELLPDILFDVNKWGGNTKVCGSEDFSYITNRVPSLMCVFSVGSVDKGYLYPAHNPNARFDDSKLYIGSAIYAMSAIAYLNKNN